MCKFKGRSTIKQYTKNKPIKWGFKHWYRCDSETGYVYKLELYQGRKAIKFRFECGTRLMPSPERNLLSRVF